MKFIMIVLLAAGLYAETAQQKKDAELVRRFQEINRKQVALENEKADILKAFDCEARGMQMQLDPVHFSPACTLPPVKPPTPPTK